MIVLSVIVMPVVSDSATPDSSLDSGGGLALKRPVPNPMQASPPKSCSSGS